MRINRLLAVFVGLLLLGGVSLRCMENKALQGGAAALQKRFNSIFIFLDKTYVSEDEYYKKREQLVEIAMNLKRNFGKGLVEFKILKHLREDFLARRWISQIKNVLDNVSPRIKNANKDLIEEFAYTAQRAIQSIRHFCGGKIPKLYVSRVLIKKCEETMDFAEKIFSAIRQGKEELTKESLSQISGEPGIKWVEFDN